MWSSSRWPISYMETNVEIELCGPHSFGYVCRTAEEMAPCCTKPKSFQYSLLFLNNRGIRVNLRALLKTSANDVQSLRNEEEKNWNKNSYRECRIVENFLSIQS